MVTASELGLNPKKAHVFEGFYCNIMPQLVAAGFEPWSPADIMDAQHAALGTAYQAGLLENYVDTDCGIAGTSKKVYVVPHSLRLRVITFATQLVDYGFPLREDNLPAGVKVYDRSELILGRDLTEAEARTSPLWLEFATRSQERLDRKVEDTFRLGKNQYNYDTMMGIYGISNGKIPIELALVLGGLVSRSRANGSGSLNVGSDARLVGVRS